jgi:hypothetical protein
MLCAIPNPGIIAGPRLSGGIPYLRATITVASGEVTADVTDFPVRVALADLPAGFWSNVASDGSDIQIFDASETQLPRDLVTFNYGAETGDLFFKADLLTASDNVFYVAAGSGAAAPSNGSTYGRNNVWTAFYRAFVFTGNSGDDRTGSGNNLTLVGNAVLSGGELNISTHQAYADTAVSAFSDWHAGCISRGGNPATTQAFLQYSNTAFNSRAQLLYGGGGQWFTLYNETDGLVSYIGLGGGLALDKNFPVIGHDGGVYRKGWVNGVNYINQSVTSSMPVSGTTLRIGDTSTDGYRGWYDLVYMRTAIPVDAWIAAQYAAWFTPSNFYTVT